MDTVWVGIGIGILALTLLDVFLTALNYDEAGFFSGRLAVWQWHLTRRFTRRIARRWRPIALRQVTGLQIIVTVLAWLGGVILGFALIYLGLMPNNGFQFDGARDDFFGAVYFSAAQLATVGTSQLSPNTDLLRALSIAETLTGVVLVSLILTFLLGVYDVVSSLRSLSAQFFSGGRGIGDPIATLTPYFPNGEPRGLDGHLAAVSDSFGSYTDGIRLHHSAYYFQSGRDTFSLPYSIRMMSGTIGGLRWGLPRGHPSSEEPTLLPLTEQFDQFKHYMHPLIGWTSAAVPETVPRAEFRRLIAAEEARHRNPSRGWTSGVPEPEDPWVARFAGVNRQMAALVHGAALADVDEAYDRYVDWLPFAYGAQQFTTAISHDLDYQPVYADDSADSGRDADAAASGPPARRPGRVRNFFARRLTLIDPGYIRLRGALLVLGSAIAAVALLAVGLNALGLPVMPTAVFGGMVCMFSAGAAGAGAGKRGLARLAGLVAVVPVLFAVGLNAFVPHDPVPAGLALVALAFVAMLLGGYGPAAAGLGQLAFVTFYFSLLLRLQAGEAWLYAGAAIVSVLLAVLVQALPSRRTHVRAVRGGVKAFEERVARVLEPLIDTVSGARWDPDLRGRVHGQLKQLHRSAAFLSGSLTGDGSRLGLNAEQLSELRLRVFDAELATVNVSTAASSATGAGVPMPLRAVLAGELQELQRHVRGYSERPPWAVGGAGQEAGSAGATGPPWADDDGPDSPIDWPATARRLRQAVRELGRATDALHTASSADLTAPPPENGSHPGNRADTGAAVPAAAGNGDTAPDTEMAAEMAADTEMAEEMAADTAGPDAGAPPGRHSQAGPSAGASTAQAGGAAADAGPSRSAFAVPLRRAVQAAFSTGLALWLGSLVSVSYQYWAALPAFQVLGGTDGETFIKGTQRIIGTVAGAAVGFGLALLVGDDPLVLLPVLALCVFAATYLRAVSAPLATFWQTVLFAQLYEMLGRLDTETIELRVLETVIGAAIALTVAVLLLPTRTRSKLAVDTTQLVSTVADVTTVCLTRLRGEAGAGLDPAALTRREHEMTAQLRQVQQTAAPLRRALGAFDTRGIEDQLTALWALLFYTRHLVVASEAVAATAGAPGLSAEQWDRVQAATEANFAALLALLDGRLPTSVVEELGVEELEDVELGGELESALHWLVRINQTVAVLVDIGQPENGRVAKREG